MSLTDDHQQLLLLFNDVDLEDRSQTRDVGQRVLDDVQRVQTLLRAHQDYLRQEGTQPLAGPTTEAWWAWPYLIGEGEGAVDVQPVVPLQLQQRVPQQLLEAQRQGERSGVGGQG